MIVSPLQALDDFKAGRYRPVYLLVGEDAAQRSTLVQALKEKLKPDPFNVDERGPEDAEDAVSAALTPPVFSDRRLVVIRGGTLPAAARKAVVEYLGDPFESTTLVLHCDDRKPDLKDSITTAANKAGAVVEFRPLGEEEAATKLVAEAKKAGVNLEEDAADCLVQEAGTHWGILKAELQKILAYAKGKASVTREDALACLGYKQAVNPFALANAVAARDRKQALTVLERLFEEGEDEFRLLYQVTSTVNRQLKAKRALAAGLGEDGLIGELRMHPYVARETARQARALNEGTLTRAVAACVETEANLKSKAWLDPRIELGRLVAWICR